LAFLAAHTEHDDDHEHDQEKSRRFFIVLIVGPKLFIEPGTKAFFQLSSVSGPGL
jgi:hypothetical protein